MACMIPVGSIYLQAPSCRWGNWKARSHSFVGPPMRTLWNRTVPSPLRPSFQDGGGKISFNLYSPVDKTLTRVLNKTRSSSSIGEGEAEEEEEESVSLGAVPLLMLPPSFSFSEGGSNMSYNFFSPLDKKVTSLSKIRSIIGGEGEDELINLESAVLVGCSHGWLALRKGQSDYDLFMYNPISHRIIKLPPVETIPLPEELREELRPQWGRPDKVILSCPQWRRTLRT